VTTSIPATATLWSGTSTARRRAAARRLGLEFEHRHVGLEPFSDAVTSAVSVALSKRVA